MKDDDLDRVREIAEMSWRGQGGAWMLEQRFGRMGGKSWLEWMWMDMLTKFKVRGENFVTTVDASVAGFARFHLNHDMKVATLGYNAVDPAFRGRSIGKNQMAFIRDIFLKEKMQYAEVMVSTDDGHAAARHQYDNFGLKIIDIIEEYYGRIPDVIPMSVCEPIKLRKAMPSDYGFIKERLRVCLEAFHRYALVEKEYGLIAKTPWLKRLWNEIEARLARPDAGIMLVYRDGEYLGLAGYNIHRETLVGQISFFDVFRNDYESDLAAIIECMAEWFREYRLRLIQVSGLAAVSGERNIMPHLLQKYGFAELTVATEYRFCKL